MSCFALVAFCCLFMGEQAGPMLLTMLCHEGGHLAALWLLRNPPRQVELWGLGCRIQLPPGPGLTPWGQVAVSLMGPFANLAASGLWGALGLGSGAFAQGGLVLGLLHLLPVEPLDGGLALGCALGQLMPPERARRVCRAVGGLVLVPLSVLGFLVLLRTRYNYTLLALSLYLMLYLVCGKDYAC